MCKCTRIEHNPIKFLIRFMNPVDNYTFMIRLYALNFYPIVSACSLKLLFKILKISVPYTAGSRTPKRFKLGPFITKILFIFIQHSPLLRTLYAAHLCEFALYFLKNHYIEYISIRWNIHTTYSPFENLWIHLLFEALQLQKKWNIR